MTIGNDELQAFIALTTVVMGAIGWATKTSIINPLSNNISALSAVVAELKGLIDNIRSEQTEIDKRLLLAEQKIEAIEEHIDRCKCH